MGIRHKEFLVEGVQFHRVYSDQVERIWLKNFEIRMIKRIWLASPSARFEASEGEWCHE